MKKFFLLIAILVLGISTFSQTDDKALMVIDLKDYDGNPITNEYLIIKDITTGENLKKQTNEEGIVKVELKKGSDIEISYLSPTGEVSYDPVTIPTQVGKLTFNYSLKFKATETKTYTLDNVYFELDKAILKERSYNAIDPLIEYMTLKKDVVVEIGGHTDALGDAEYNLNLSRKRAEAVKAYMVKQGIAAGRIQTKGYGESQPIASNDTEEGRARNRRTEVKLLK